MTKTYIHNKQKKLQKKTKKNIQQAGTQTTRHDKLITGRNTELRNYFFQFTMLKTYSVFIFI